MKLLLQARMHDSGETGATGGKSATRRNRL